MDDHELSLHDVLRAYAIGLFPMADEGGADEFYWYDPPQRGQLPIESLHVPQRLKKTVRRMPYDVRVNTAFDRVIALCAEEAPDRPRTWINPAIRDIFLGLHQAGFAHSVECWRGAELVGGLYGLALGGAFCGESMFSRARDASKIALVHLCARLWDRGFTVLDTQFVNPHLEQFGVYEISRDTYREKLAAALRIAPDFTAPADEAALLAAYPPLQADRKTRG